MKIDVIMIENMILTMSRYFILRKKQVDNEYKQAFGLRHYQFWRTVYAKLDNGVSRKLVCIRYRPIFSKYKIPGHSQDHIFNPYDEYSLHY